MVCLTFRSRSLTSAQQIICTDMKLLNNFSFFPPPIESVEQVFILFSFLEKSTIISRYPSLPNIYLACFEINSICFEIYCNSYTLLHF